MENFPPPCLNSNNALVAVSFGPLMPCVLDGFHLVLKDLSPLVSQKGLMHFARVEWKLFGSVRGKGTT